MIDVSWNDIQGYLAWLNRKSGKQYRLPTEAEWEYAARAGTETAYWWGDEVGKGKTNCNGCGSKWDNKQTAPVGSFAANPRGLYDTAGNALEWACSKYSEKYSGEELECADKNDAGRQVLRGGSWGVYLGGERAALRIFGARDDRSYNLGFRLARTL